MARRKAGAAEGLGVVSGKRYTNMPDDETETGWGSDVSSEGAPEVRVDAVMEFLKRLLPRYFVWYIQS